MSMLTSSNSEKSAELSKEEAKPLNIVIKKPRKRVDSCTTQYEGEPTPTNNRATSEAKKSKDVGETRSDSESISYWLKPGVSLPRVHSDESGRPDAGEPYSSKRHPCSQKLIRHDKSARQSIYSLRSSSLEGLNLKSPSLESPACVSDIEMDRIARLEWQNISGLSKCNLEFKISSSKCNIKNFEITGDEMEESHALRQWKIWLKRRKRLQDYLQMKLKRPASHLVLNRSETFRQVIESKAVEAYCNLLKEGKRGTKERKKTEKILCQTVCFGESVPSKKIPEIEFIGLPEIIKKEKNLIRDLSGSTRSERSPCEIAISQRKTTCHGKKKRETRITHLQCIDIEHLAVTGRKYPIVGDTDKPLELELIDFPILKAESERKSLDAVERQEIFFLVVGDREIKYESGSDFHPNSPDESLTWKIDFGSNPTGTVLQRTLSVENRGTVVISYEWICPKVNHEIFNASKPALAQPWFFFNKNSGMFIPGKIYDFKFYSRARREGTRTEIWYIKTNPPISKSDDKLKIILSTFATSDCSEQKINSVEKYLDRRVGISISMKILNDIVTVAMQPRYLLREIEYRSLLTDKMIFEFQNSKHYYHSEELRDLKQMYLRYVCLPSREWDLSFSTLLKMVKHCVLKEPEKESLVRRIFDASKKLLRPPYVMQSKNRKHHMAYHILASICNSIDSDWDYLKSCLSFKRSDKLSICLFEDESLSEERSTWEGESIVSHSVFEASPNNQLFLETMFYIRVYYKLCEAAERIAGMVESINFTRSEIV